MATLHLINKQRRGSTFQETDMVLANICLLNCDLIFKNNYDAANYENKLNAAINFYCHPISTQACL
jgi:hypothetical protein